MIGVFEQTLAKTNHWLDALGLALGTDDREHCYHALKAVLHTLRDRLPVGEAADLGAQLPMLIRGFYYEGWRPAGRRPAYRHKRQFVDRVHRRIPQLDEAEIERVTTAVFGLLSSELAGGEPGQVRRALPAEVRELWALPRM
jgi:uncharacterized protein (DUF2267 family)